MSVGTPSHDAVHVLKALKSKPFTGFANERAELVALLRSTINGGESNSVIILGPRGTGKTALLHAALADVGLSDSNRTRTDVLVIHLHGLVDTNDRLALKKVARFLHLERALEDKVFGSFAEQLEFLLAGLKQTNGNEDRKPIVFVLEELDLFCGHHNQTLLYNLFDNCQSKSIPMLVIGLTARIDVVELMEKRVQSRFGRRCIFLKKIGSFDEYYNIVHYFLEDESCSKSWKRSLKTFLGEAETQSFFREQVFFRDPTVAFLKQLIYLSVLSEKMDDRILLRAFESALEELCPNSDELPIASLPMLDLTLLIACMQKNARFPKQHFNFETIFEEYRKFVSRKCSLLSHDRNVMMKCWENLISLELLRPVDRGNKVQNEYKLYVLNVADSDIRRVIEDKGDKVFTSVRNWAHSDGHM